MRRNHQHVHGKKSDMTIRTFRGKLPHTHEIRRCRPNFPDSTGLSSQMNEPLKPAPPAGRSGLPRRKDFLVFGAPALEQAEMDAVLAVMKSSWLGTGPKVAQFERDFCAYKGGGTFPVAVNSCTAALHLSMLACEIEPGAEVITSALTFCATVNAIIHAGLKPVLADVDPVTMNLDPRDVERRITARTRALIPVHFAGRACDMDELGRIACQHRLRIIEDCAHAIETTWRGRPAGTFGDFGCFSFYVTKNIITGEGGMILSATEDGAARCKVLALHGLSKDAWKRFGDEGYKHYQVVRCGYKYNMMDLQAAIGIEQLKRVEPYWKRREALWGRYTEAFRDLPLQPPAPPAPGSRHGHHLYTLLLDEQAAGLTRDQFLDGLTRRNIGVGVHYLSIPEHPFYQATFGWRPEDYPHARRIGRTTVSIPLSARLTDEDAEDVIAAVKDTLKK
jgi:dTDP-4-amino-4,6-dideoxygalactose transaminase